ncbi:MAG: ABC transporter permease subunit [Nitriliruptorales bacterium]|nr:ABC transporter permease subunit [Nitriliruptorales bacterium]
MGLAAAVVLLGAIAVVPLFELVRTVAARGWSAVGDAFAAAGSGRAAWNTLWTAALVTPVALALATAAAVVTERSRARARTSLRLAIAGSLLVPSFVTAQSWAAAYGPGGLLDDLVGIALPRTFGALGVASVLIVSAVPLAYLVLVAALRSDAQPDLERAARASGADAWTTFRTVTLPLLRPALVGGGALVFVVTVNAFGIPAILGLPGGFVTMTTRIYRDLSFAADPAAFDRVVVLATSLVVLAVAVVSLADVLGARSVAGRTAAPSGTRAAAGRRSWWPTLAVGVGLLLVVGIPLLSLGLVAVTRGVGLPPVPANWTLANFEESLSSSAVTALRNSVVLAVVAATVVMLLGALLVALRRRRGGRLLGVGTILTFALPGSTLAVAVLLAYGSLLRDTLALILIAYLAKFWALGHRTLVGSVDAVPADLVRAARASGAGALTAVRTILAPLVAPALVAGWLLVALTAFHELTMSSLLYGPGTATLAVVILNAQQLGDVTVTAALAVMLTGIVIVVGAPLLLIPGVRRAVSG